MEKLKLKIKGMRSVSDSSSIENSLKKQDGIVMPKFNYESGKGIVIYDKNKIHEQDICRLIKKMGDYGADVKNKKPEESVNKYEKSSNCESFTETNAVSCRDHSLWLGILTGICAVSILVNIILLIALNK